MTKFSKQGFIKINCRFFFVCKINNSEYTDEVLEAIVLTEIAILTESVISTQRVDTGTEFSMSKDRLAQVLKLLT